MGGRVVGQGRVSASGFQLGQRGQITGDLWVWASSSQRVEVDGTVNGSVYISGTDLHLGRTSHIDGSKTVYSGRVVND